MKYFSSTQIILWEQTNFIQRTRLLLTASVVQGSEFLTVNPEVLVSISSGSVVVKALCYKPEGRGFETR
jgi:hypothetical protein